jgi:tetratricopeptide (TPR) repeat protein
MKLIGRFWILVILVILLTPCFAFTASIAFRYYEQGVQLAAQGKFAEAGASFDNALKVEPQNYPVQRCLSVLADVEKRRIKEQTATHLFRGFAAFNRYRIDEAIQELSRAVELDPGYPPAYSHRADAYRDKGQVKEALADYGRALAIDPKYSVAYLNRANLYAGKSEFDQAVADYTRVLQIESRNILAYYSRGNAYARQGRHEEAIADYDALLAINPLYPHAYVRKGLACENLGRHGEALAAYNAYLEKLTLGDQDPQQVKWVRDKVKSLEKKP